jgi:hypothetical protein
MTAIPAITLHRPWAELILVAGKDVENRTWSTNYRGPLYIHAGKAWDSRAHRVAVRAGADGCVSWEPDEHARGIIGAVDLVDVLNGTSPSVWAAPDQFHWRLVNPRLLMRPVECNGWQRLWTPEPRIAAILDDEAVWL